MSVPVCLRAGRDVWDQDVVVEVAGLAVCVYATERGGRINTCVYRSDVEGGGAVWVSAVP